MKYKLHVALFICIINLGLIFGQSQIGNTINSVAANDLLGRSVSLSENGLRIAVGAPENGSTNGGNGQGYVKIYELNNNSWVQLGNDIDGISNNDEFGANVAMSADGNRVAIGAQFRDINDEANIGEVTIYEWDGNVWEQLGNSVIGASSNDEFAFSLDISPEGNRIAVGAIGNNNFRGNTRIYEFDGTNWNQLGNTINGPVPEAQFGLSMDLSSNGSRIAISAVTDINGEGSVRVYMWNGTAWAQEGNTIEGVEDDFLFGFGVSLSNDGNIVAIGNSSGDSAGTHIGTVRIFNLNVNTWEQLGQNINGDNDGDEFGHSVSLSSDGTRILIGAISDENTSNIGYARQLEWNGTNWEQIGNDITSSSIGEKLGFSVSLSGNGNILALGAPFNDENGELSGQVRIYESALLTVNENTFDNITLYPNPTKNILNIESVKSIKRIDIIDVLGKVVYNSQTTTNLSYLNLSHLTNGIYFIKITNIEGLAILRKIVKN